LAACCGLAAGFAADGDCAAAGAAPPDPAVEDRLKLNTSEGSGFDVGAGSGASATSSGVTISTAIGSAVTDANGWTSAKKNHKRQQRQMDERRCRDARA
jgi:hypothetical protein